MKFFFFLIFLIFSSFLILSFRRMPKGEYIVSSKKDIDQEVIKQTLSKLAPDTIRPLSKRAFFIQYNVDPGIKKIENFIGKSLSVQPNYPYQVKK